MDEFENIDFDKLNVLERETYLKTLEMVESSKITLEDYRKYVGDMLTGATKALIDEPEYIYSEIFTFLKRPNPKIPEIKARIKVYLIFKSFFDRPEQAKAQLELLKKKVDIK